MAKLTYNGVEVRFNLDEGRADSLAKSMVVSFAEKRGGEGTLPNNADKAAAVEYLRGMDDESAEIAASIDVTRFQFV